MHLLGSTNSSFTASSFGLNCRTTTTLRQAGGLRPEGRSMSAERTPHADDSLLAAPLVGAYRVGHPRAGHRAGRRLCAIALLAVAVTVNGLTFKTSRLDLLNPRSEYNQRWLAYLSEFGDRDDACLVVRAERKADLTAAIDDVAAQLRQRAASCLIRCSIAAICRDSRKGAALSAARADCADSAASHTRPRRCCRAAASPATRPRNLPGSTTNWRTWPTTTSQQRTRTDEQYAKATGMLLATLGGTSHLAAPSSACIAFPIPGPGAIRTAVSAGRRRQDRLCPDATERAAGRRRRRASRPFNDCGRL